MGIHRSWTALVSCLFVSFGEEVGGWGGLGRSIVKMRRTCTWLTDRQVKDGAQKIVHSLSIWDEHVLPLAQVQEGSQKKGMSENPESKIPKCCMM